MKCLWRVVQGNIPNRRMRRRGEMVVPEIGGNTITGHGVLAAHLAVVHHHLAIPILQEDGTQVHARGTDVGPGNLTAFAVVFFVQIAFLNL
jgi:hypothetical protein